MMDGKADRILVVGGTGLVGNALVRAWLGRGAHVVGATYHCHPSPFFRALDMQDARGVDALVDEVRPSLVAVPAANPYVDYCELHPEETRRVNVDGTLNVARAAKRHGARVVFFSSDYVFDGRKGHYKEEEPVSPINEYGRQKAEVEEAVLALDSRNLVVRTSGAYGWQHEPKNFVLQVRKHLTGGQAMHVSTLLYNPTYSDNLAEATAELAARGARGLFHVVGTDRIVRVEFARLAAEAFGLDPDLVEASTDELARPARRPLESSLDTGKVRALGIELLGAERGLRLMRQSEEKWRASWAALAAPSKI